MIIYDLAEDSREERVDLRRQITFYNQDTRRMKAWISQDFNSVVLINNDEYHLLKKINID